MNITVTIIPHKTQRYETVGDWEFDDFGNLNIKISQLGNDKMNCLIMIHELVEAILCKFSNPEVTTDMVDTFDFANQQLKEPGDDPTAPYHMQHKAASIFEIQLAYRLGVNWKEYEERINSI